MLGNVVRCLRPYLHYRQWIQLCLALRLPPIAPFTDEYENLSALDPAPRESTSPKSESVTPAINQAVTEDCLSPKPHTLGRDGAYLLQRRHLHVSLPWREPGEIPIDGIGAAGLLDRVFSKPDRKLESIHVHIRIPVPGLREVMTAVNRLVKAHAATLQVLSVSCDFVTPASQLSALSSGAPASAPATARRQGAGAACVSVPMLQLQNVFFPALLYLNLAVPVEANGLTQLPTLCDLNIKYLGPDELRIWSRGCADREQLVEQLLLHQSVIYDTLLKQSCCSLESLRVSGDLASRQDGRIFLSFGFLPKLRALSLGWTCEEELRALLSALRYSSTSLRTILNESQSNEALCRSFRLACKEMRWSDDITLRSSLADPAAAVQVPPKLPTLKRLSFSGPLRMGLSDLHLDLYTLVNETSGRGVHFQYGLFSARAKRVLEFRMEFKKHPFFSLYRDLQSRLHHLYIKGIVEDEQVPWHRMQSKRAVAEPVASDWVSLLAYHHVNPNTATRQLHRAAQRADFRQQGFSTVAPCPKWTTEHEPPPQVGPHMTALDLFKLEMWHLPVVCLKDFEDCHTVTMVWESFLTDDDRLVWEDILERYRETRSAVGPLSFESILPWWKCYESASSTSV
eukprot:Blabericola_migrator_1__4704@NODE_2483_length_2699_cov_114_175152_g1556_i0_p1_GENE_NODE_2483_length_2699_cov_114_175152_g1556_i0NODE_2483_length_2699_cov_114_175152_g1556_i0_p1_ORF_typecomplete_len626_score67_16_NODE_2483_length_2699_cov_114_175152_g1556_i06952572